MGGSSSSSSSRWQDLPSDLVRSLAERLSGVDDLVRLGAVCRPWSEALTGFRPVYFPLLVLTSRLRSNEVPVYSLINYRVNRFPVPTTSPPLAGDSPSRLVGSRVVGYHHGWLVTVDASLDVLIFNPLTGDRANLPSFFTRRGAESDPVKKVALSSVPSAASGYDTVAAAVHWTGMDEAIAFAKVGDGTWTRSLPLGLVHVTDVVFYRGNFFVINFHGQFKIVSPSGHHLHAVADPWESWMAPRLLRYEYDEYCVYFNLALSPSSGHLLVVGRVATKNIGRRLVVCKFDPVVDDADSSSSSRRHWVEIKDLGDEALFFTPHHAMLLPVGRSNGSRIRRNCIYFTYSSAPACLGLGKKPDEDYFNTVEVFDVEKGVFEPSPFAEQRSWMRYWKKESLFWFLPSLS